MQLDAQFFFNFIQQIKRIFTVTVELINKHNNGRVSHSTHFHQFSRLLFYPFYPIHHQNNTINGSQCAVGVFSKIFVTWRIEEVNQHALVLKGHHRSSHTDTTLTFNFHEIAGSMFFNLVAFYCTCSLDSTTKK